MILQLQGRTLLKFLEVQIFMTRGANFNSQIKETSSFTRGVRRRDFFSKTSHQGLITLQICKEKLKKIR